jgi:hypothetical protein
MIAFVSLIVSLGLHKSIFTEITAILGILAISLFVLFFVGLYRGMILQAEEPQVLNDAKINIEKKEFYDPSSYISWFSSFEFNIWMSWIIISILAIWVLSYLFLFGLYFLILFLMVLYLVFYLAYGLVFSHSQGTKGDIVKSFGYSVAYTILYTGLFFILLQVIKIFQHS